MSEQQEKFRVSCKVVFFNPERTKVLVAHYGGENYGLVGGHMDKSDTPDEAMLREVREEIGINYTGKLKKVGFRMVNKKIGHKLCLEYVGELDESTELNVDKTELYQALWVPVEDIKNDKISLRDYKAVILEQI